MLACEAGKSRAQTERVHFSRERRSRGRSGCHHRGAFSSQPITERVWSLAMMSLSGLLLIAVALQCGAQGVHFANEWVVRVPQLPHLHEACRLHNLTILGPLGSLPHYYRLRYNCSATGQTEACIPSHQESVVHTDRLRTHPGIHWARQEQAQSRARRQQPSDPLYDKQWFLHPISATNSVGLRQELTWSYGYNGR